MKKNNNYKFSTRAIHIGSQPDELTGAVIPPIYQTSTYKQQSPGKHKGFEYSRTHNPTRQRLEMCLASLENAKFCIATSSGLSATMLLMHLLPPKSTIVCGDDVYGGTYRMFTTVFHNYHNFIFTDTSDFDKASQIIVKEKPAMIWLESASNPLLKITDLVKLDYIANKIGAISVVDNTFMTPFFSNPLNFGIDIVLHSTSKFINGHSDVIGGAIMTNNNKFYELLYTLQNSLGPTLSPFDSWLILRGAKTLGIRMKQHQENALSIAKFLERHPKIAKVIYPGLKSHPQQSLAKKLFSGFGAMITFFINGGLIDSRKFLESLKIFTLAESLGGIESLIEHPAIMTHASVPESERLKIGITDNLIRCSVGIENSDDLIDDLKQALG